MRSFPTGVTVVTARGADGPMGLTVSSFTSVSLEPPLVLVCIDRDATSHDLLLGADGFAINILSADQEGLARRFAADPASGRFDGVAWRPSARGAPLLDGACAWLECSLDAVHPGGDHSILVARVEDARARPASPLIWIRGGFGAIGP